MKRGDLPTQGYELINVGMQTVAKWFSIPV